MPSSFQKALKILREELDAVADPSETNHVIFASTALKLRGIIERDPGDIDVMVTKEVWGKLLPRPGWKFKTPKSGHPPILRYKGETSIDTWFAWENKYSKIDIDELFARAEWIDTEYGKFRVASVQDVIDYKKARIGVPAAGGSSNDKRDVKAAKDYLKKRSFKWKKWF